MTIQDQQSADNVGNISHMEELGRVSQSLVLVKETRLTKTKIMQMRISCRTKYTARAKCRSVAGMIAMVKENSGSI